MKGPIPDVEVKVVVNNWNGLREKGLDGYRELLEKLKQNLDDISISYKMDIQSDEEIEAMKIGNIILDSINKRICESSDHRY